MSQSRLKRRVDQYLEVEQNPASVLTGKLCCQRLLMIHPEICGLLIAILLASPRSGRFTLIGFLSCMAVTQDISTLLLPTAKEQKERDESLLFLLMASKDDK